MTETEKAKMQRRFAVRFASCLRWQQPWHLWRHIELAWIKKHVPNEIHWKRVVVDPRLWWRWERSDCLALMKTKVRQVTQGGIHFSHFSLSDSNRIQIVFPQCWSYENHMSYIYDMCFQSVSNWIESSESCRFHSIRWNSLGDFTEFFHGGRFFLNLFFTISSRLAFKACISSSKSQSTTKRHQANAMYTPLRSRYIMILSAPPFATDTEVQSNRTVICGLATSPHGPPFLHRNQSMWKSHQITSKSFLCSFAGSKSSSWQFFFPPVWVRFSANAKKLHNVVFNNEETFPASQLSFFSSAWSFSSEKNGKSVAALLDVTSPVELVDRWTGDSGQRGIQLTVGNPSELSGPQPSKNLLGHIWKRNNWQLFDSLKRVKISPVKPMKNIANNKYYQNTFTTRYDVGPLSLVRPHPRPPRPFVHGLGAIGADRNLPLSQHLREPRLGTWKKWKKWENGKEHL